MRWKWLAALLIAVSPLVAAGNPACVISFDSARLDVCTGTLSLADDDPLRSLAEPAGHHASRVRVVKFAGPVGRATREALESRGAEILGYAPHHAYVVRMPPSLDARMRDLDGVVWVGPFLPVWKLEANLINQLRGMDIVNRAGLEHLRVTLQRGVPVRSGRALVTDVDGLDFVRRERGQDQERLVVSFDPARLDSVLEALVVADEVAAINLHWPRRPLNSQAGWLHQSGEADLTPVFDQGLFGCGQVIGVLDTGVHPNHCSFDDPAYGLPAHDICSAGADCVAITPDFGHRKVGAHYNWSGGSGAPADLQGHGTHVAASAVGNNRANPVDCESFTSPGGTSDLDGTAPGARLIAQEAGPGLDYLNSLGGSIDHAARVAYDNGARIHNNSWGSSCRDTNNQCIPGCQVGYRPASRDADQVVWEHPELALFVAAGNSGSGCGPGADVGSAGNGKNVFSIGSNVRGHDGDDMSFFSSRGPTSDRRTKPDLVAQGGGASAATMIHSAATGTDCGVATDRGTSMASPTAAGLAALVREYLERGFHPLGEPIPGLAIPDPSAALVKAILINGAATIEGEGAGRQAAANRHQGWGRIHLDQALYFAGDARRLWLHEDNDGLETGAAESHSLVVDGDQPLSVTLVWHDHPGMLNADPHIVNRLRLEVEAPDGLVWTQKLPVDGGLADSDPFQDTTEEHHDGRNTVHRIRLEEPLSGPYELRVLGVEVAAGDRQPYALVASGALNELAEPGFVLRANPDHADICAGEGIELELEVQSILDFDDPVTLAPVGDLPPGMSAVFADNPVTPTHPATGVELVLDGTAAVPAGMYVIDIAGESDGPNHSPSSHSATVELQVSSQSPQPGVLSGPPNQAAEQPLQPVFTWQDFADTRSYRFQLATDPDFENILEDRVIDGTSHAVDTRLESVRHHYWRVAGINPCGQGSFSQPFRFSTLQLAGDCPLGSDVEVLAGADFSGGVLPPNWSSSSSTGAGAWTVTDARSYSGEHSVLASDSGGLSDQHLTLPELNLPNEGEGLLLAFRTWQHIESWPLGAGCFDGAVVEVSVDEGESWTPIGDKQILTRPLDGPVSTSWGNPLGGSPAWCGDPRDEWERYAIDLGPWAGHTTRLRLRYSTDIRGGHEGWYVDDVAVRACSPPSGVVFEDRFELP